MKHTIPTMMIWALCIVPGLAQAQECGETVTVDAGDTLYEIAQECDTNVSAIVAANDQINNRNVIGVGWTLTVPNGDQAPPADQPEPNHQPRTPQADYIVRAGDTLAEIAARHTVSLSALIDANPQIGNPNVIEVGLALRIPDENGRVDTDPRRPTWSGNVSIEPNSGAPGTRVRVRASGFPPTTSVNIGAGPVGSEYEVTRSDVRTNANGGLVARAELPEYADPQAQWVFVVETDDHRIRGRSEPFNVRLSDGNRNGNRVIIRGQLTGEGIECPAIRAQDGSLYTLAGNIGQFEEGDYVRIEGTVADVSVCMQGTTLSVSTIRSAQ